MEYKGKLYGKIFNKYFDTGYTAEDWDNLEKLVSELERRVEALSQHDVIKNEVALIALLRDIKTSYDVTGGIMPQEMKRINEVINDL